MMNKIEIQKYISNLRTSWLYIRFFVDFDKKYIKSNCTNIMFRFKNKQNDEQN